MPRLIFLRHAPLPQGIGLAGRRDISAVIPPETAFLPLREKIASLAPVGCLTSPARRCVETARALGVDATSEPALWEQDFGAWEGLQPQDLPDLGPLSMDELAKHRAENGESFSDMSLRVNGFIKSIDADSLIVAHAGTARAALSLIIGPAALSFAIAPLSLTVINGQPGAWAVEMVNWVAP